MSSHQPRETQRQTVESLDSRPSKKSSTGARTSQKQAVLVHRVRARNRLWLKTSTPDVSVFELLSATCRPSKSPGRFAVVRYPERQSARAGLAGGRRVAPSPNDTSEPGAGEVSSEYSADGSGVPSSDERRAAPDHSAHGCSPRLATSAAASLRALAAMYASAASSSAATKSAV
jgi:hypothetical protein